MTVSRNDIQQLIAEVDQLLLASRTPEGDAVQQQPPEYSEVLEKVRWCLSNLVRQVEVPGGEMLPVSAPEHQTAQAIAQAVMTQMNLQRQDWLQPMQLELEALRQQRETLHRDIRHLESHQRQMSHELLQTVMHRCSESLKQELATVFDRLQGQFSVTLTGPKLSTDAPPALQQLDWLEKLRSLEQQADQLFLSLDQTFHQVFVSLEQDVQSYHQSLQQRLGQMHELQQLQHQTLLSSALPATALPQLTDVTAVGQTPPTTEMPLLQMDVGEPLPSLEPLHTNEFVLPAEPIEQVLHLDLLAESSDAQTPHSASQRIDPHAVSGDQAWEAWDEYLFTRDPGQAQPLMTPDAPRVLTVDLPTPSAQAPSTPQPETPSRVASPPLLSEMAIVPDLPRAMQQELFASLGDPAQVTAEPEFTVAADEASPVGTVLFGDPVVSETTTIAAEELTAALDPDLDAEISDDQGPSLEETIASLDDLLEQVSARMAEAPMAVADADGAQQTIPAGETLLTTEEVSARTPSGQLDTVLDAQRMQQLSADLASFEGANAEGATQGPAPGPAAPVHAAEAASTANVAPAEAESVVPQTRLSQQPAQQPVSTAPAPPREDPPTVVFSAGSVSAPTSDAFQPMAEPDIPAQMVLSALSDLGWDALIDEANNIEGDDQADLWGEQPQQRSAETTAVGSSGSSPA